MRWIFACVALGVLAGGVWAEEPRTDEVAGVEEALELRRRLEALLESLSPESRAEFERRWAEMLEVEQESTGAPQPDRVEALPPRTDAPSGKAAPPSPDSGVAPADLAVAAEGPGEDTERSNQEETETLDIPAEPAPAQTAVSEPAPPSAPPGPQEPREDFCNTLYVLDSNGDGWVSGADRFWRYLGLWVDNGDGRLAETEVKSLFKQRIRKVSARLYSYTTVKEVDGGIWLEDRIYFDLPGSGPRSRAALTLNAGGLGRSGDFWVEDGKGARLDGTVAIESGVAVVSAEGGRHPILCR